PAPARGRPVPNRRAGISAIAARSSGLPARQLGWFARLGRSRGNDHGSFRSHFGVQEFEKPVGTAGFEPATLDPAMHPYPHHQVIIMTQQVTPRTGERNGAA